MSAGAAAFGVLASYALGSVSFAYLIVKARKGIDLRTVGSGNLGATNVARALGAKAAVLVYVLDCLKGLGPVLVARLALGDPLLGGAVPLSVLMGAAAYAGHCYPFHLGFRGGKGVATGSGVVLGLAPLAMAAALAVFAAAVLLSRMISLGSMLAALTLPVAYVAIHRAEATRGRGLAILTFLLALAVMVLLRHRANVQRMIEGTESRIGRRKP